MDESAQGERRRAPRYAASLPVSTQTVDPLRDPLSGERYFRTSDEDQTVDLSLRGLRLRAEHAPTVGTRLLLHLEHAGEGPIDLLGRTRWARIELKRGPGGRHATCGIGIELLGGSRTSLDRYERLVERAASEAPALQGSGGSDTMPLLERMDVEGKDPR
jgi:hypothetical protein